MHLQHLQRTSSKMDKPLRNSINGNDTTTQELMLRDLCFDPKLHVFGKRLGCISSTGFVNNVSSKDPRLTEKRTSRTTAHRGSSAACAGSSMPITAASTISGCSRRTLSSSAGGTAEMPMLVVLRSCGHPIHLGSPKTRGLNRKSRLWS